MYARSPLAPSERTGASEVDGIPEPVRGLYSRRHERIVEVAEAGRQERDRAPAETRRAKHWSDAATMRGSWRQRAEEAGGDVDAMVTATTHGQRRDRVPPRHRPHEA